jgi:NAD(P)-dependent dehydrogenase (short-subunit alcohol dehydrogenase family)
MMTRRWLITGCSSGLGHALATYLTERGDQVLATARDLSGLDFPHMTRLDVRDPEQCEAAVELAVQRFGGVDVLVNNAGYGQMGVVEELSDAELTGQFDTNVFGPWRLTRAVLPHWRAQGGGHAVFVSSISGSLPLPGLAAYTASKFALEGMAESLAQDAGMFGVKVTILQLGGFGTSYGKKAVDPGRRVFAYEPVVSEVVPMVRGLADNPDITSPTVFAEVVARLVEMPEPPLRLPFGLGAREYLDAALTARRQAFDAAFAADLAR